MGRPPEALGLVIRSSVIWSLSVFGMETDGAGAAKRYPQGVGWAVCGMDADGLILKILQKNIEKCCVTRKVCLSLRRDHRGDGRAVRAA